MRGPQLFAVIVSAEIAATTHASVIAYDMRHSGEGATLDGEGSASVTTEGLTMTAAAGVSGNTGVMNARSDELGINADDTGDASGFFDDGDGTESLTFSFDQRRTLASVDFTSFGTDAAADLTVEGNTTRITSADEGGDTWGIETITTTPLPPALPAGLAGLGAARAATPHPLRRGRQTVGGG